MPVGGFYAIQSSSIRFGRDGLWYADGQPITNARIAVLFSQHVQRADDGTYFLRIADERAPIEVDDTPYVITDARCAEDGCVWLELNDRSREALDPSTLRIGPDQVLYCRVKAGHEAARFLRPAYYHLAAHIHAGDAGDFVLETRAGRHSIGRR
jgi:hypothetical protein